MLTRDSALRGVLAPRPPGSVYELFREQARRTPDGCALRFAEQTLSYAELEWRVEQLAGELASHGAAPGVLVALCAERSLDMVVAMLAIVAAGAAYVPIDPEAPRARVQLILDASAPRFVLATPATAERVRAERHRVVLLEPTRDQRHARVAGGAAGRAGAHAPELAYVIFTSGSTGTPKGVEVPHVALTNHALAMAELYELGPNDRVLCSASVGFDVAAEQIYPALVSGAQVVVRPEGLFRSLELFHAYLEQAAITTLILPTALFHEWARALASGRLQVPPALRVVGVGTEQVAAQQLASFLACSAGRVRFLQGYGPTEATITCTAYVHDGRLLAPGEPVPIGRPLPNIEVYVLDPSRKPVADGEVGELYVGGVGLARGYLGQPELTRERFVAHPFGAESPSRQAERLYRTGDLVRRARDGQLTFVGRADFQLKVRGHRVEPSEIELVLCEQPGVSEALVMLRDNSHGVPHLVAYVVTAGHLDVADLTQACRTRLPSYMVPSAFVELSSFPKTLNQKIDRAALPDPEPRARGQKLAARSDAELLVTRAFEQALGIGDVGVHDDFFALGGDSLRALHVLQLIRQSASCELATADLFGAPTVAALAARVAQGGGLDHPAMLCLKPGRGTPLFLVCGITIYQPLADALEAENPVYALLLPDEGAIANGADSLPTVEQLAAQYLQVLRAHVPEGPYALGGLSFGGVVAYELAQQLRALGQHVCAVALFDTVLPRAKRRSGRAVIAHRLRALVAGESARHAQREAFTRTLRTILRRARSAAVRLARGVRVEPQTPASGADQARALQQLEQLRDQAYGRCFRAYDRSIRSYAGRVLLYRARESEEGARLPCYGFSRLAPQLTVHDVDGDHLGLLRSPAVAQLAAHLAAALAEPVSP